MSKYYRIALFSLLLSALIGQAKAGPFFIEPFASKEKGRFEQSFDINTPRGSTDLTGKISTTGFGGRAGLSLGPIFIGGEYYKSNGRYKKVSSTFTNSSGNFTLLLEDKKSSMETIGALAGFRINNFLRFWTTYNFKNSLQLKDSNLVHYKGNNFKFALGMTMLRYMSVNVEYGLTRYDSEDGRDYSFSGTFPDGPGTAKAFTTKTWILSVSIPFGLNTTREGRPGPWIPILFE